MSVRIARTSFYGAATSTRRLKPPMTAHSERELEIAGDQAANRKPLGEPLEHRTHDESQRLQELDSVFELDRLDEKFGAAARHQRRMTATAREAYQLDASTPQPRADCVGHRTGANSPSRRIPHRASVVSMLLPLFGDSIFRGQACRAAASSGIALATGFDHAHPAASRGQMRQFLVGGDARGGFHPDPAHASD